MDNILKQLSDINKELNKPFPYKDTDKLQEDFVTEFSNLSDEENSLTGDFNNYCMNIAGTLTYVLSGKTKKIPQNQIDILQKSFFEYYKQYKFLEAHISNYKDFFEEYKIFEETRKLLIKVVK